MSCYLRLNKRRWSPLEARVRVEGKVKFRGLPLLPYAELKPPVKIFYFLFKLFVGHTIYQPSNAPQDWLGGASTYWLLDSGVWVRHRGRVRRPRIRCFILATLTSCTSVSPLVVRCSLICNVSHVSMETILLELKQFDPSTLFDTMLGYCFHKAWFICFPCK